MINMAMLAIVWSLSVLLTLALVGQEHAAAAAFVW